MHDDDYMVSLHMPLESLDKGLHHSSSFQNDLVILEDEDDLDFVPMQPIVYIPSNISYASHFR